MKKIGIYGGSFNPPHNGHLNAIQSVAKKVGLSKTHVIPAYQAPLKNPVEGPTPEQRLMLTQEAFAQYGADFVVDDREIKRKGTSFTVDTVSELREEYHNGEELYIIIGADQFENFANWKSYAKILEQANLIVTTRPGYDIPTDREELPEYLKPLVEDFDFNLIELTTGKSIQFITLKDVDVSSSELRKWLRSGRPVEKYLPLSVEQKIKSLNFYRNLGDRISDYKAFTLFCQNILSDKKGIQIRSFDLTNLSAPSEYAIVASGTSTRHATSLAENLIVAVKEEFNLHPLSLEGTEEGRWVLVDYGSLIVHVFYDFVRQEYSIEKLWKGAQELS